LFAEPTEGAVKELAEGLGIHLTHAELAAYREAATEQLRVLDAFLQTRAEELRPPLLFPERAPGSRPALEDDPHNAWLWKCSIGGGEGLLADKTVSFKDHVAVAGIPLTFNSFAFEGVIPDFDATVATRVLAAGGTIVGKNTHHGFSGLRSVGGGLGDYWDARNPSAPEHQAGGSSSGPAAAVAAGEVDVAIGGDQGGSVRHPAAYCGILGLKPTFGLVSHMGATYGGDPSIDHLGPMARAAEDIALTLQAIAGYDGGLDPRQDRSVPDEIDAVSHLRDGVEGLRIGILAEGFAEPIDEEVASGVRAAVAALADRGATVVEISVPEHHEVLRASGALQLEGYRAARSTGPFGAGARTFYPATLSAVIDRVWSDQADQMARYMKQAWIVGELSRRSFHGRVYAKAQNLRPRYTRAYDRALEAVDVLAMPTCPNLPPRVEASPASQAEAIALESAVFDSLFPTYRNVHPFNYTGHPALAVPCRTDGSLPVSLQLVGRFYQDPLLLRVAYAYEQE
jgi:amidase